MFLTELLLSCVRRIPILNRLVAPVRPENRLVFIGGKHVEFDGLDVVVLEEFCDNTVTTTKYTPWNFIFKNLYEQFLRIANFYFLIVAFIMFSVPNAPVSAVTSALPLGFVLAVTAVKQAYEDWLRRKEDGKVNSTPCQVVRNGEIVTVSAYEIQVGDIVRVNDNEQFPCDLLVLSSSDDQGQCTIQTANLDGETNLKTFLCLPETRDADTPAKLDSLCGVVDCQQPITDLYRFVGKLTVYNGESTGVTKALQACNVLLRGAKLKNTDYIYGCAIYTGYDTKLALNSYMKSGKRSSIERMLNTYLIVFVVYMVIQCALSYMLRVLSLRDVWKEPDGTRSQWYMPFIFDYDNMEGNYTHRQGFFDFLYFYIIYNYVIPISLYVTIELQKFIGSLFFGFDVDMYDENIDEPAKANTSDLNEELGQVEYLFCDKTGTLTENNMQFRQCSINGRLYTELEGSFIRNHALEASLEANKVGRVSRSNSTNSYRLSSAHAPLVSSLSKVSDTGSESAVATASARKVSEKGDGYDFVDGDAFTEDKNLFFEVLSLCHTVQVEVKTDSNSADMSEDVDVGMLAPDSEPTIATASVPPPKGYQSKSKSIDELDGKEYEYHASSPDEKALVEASRQFGYVYHGSLDNKLTVTFDGVDRQYILHDVLEFDADRKCMSVIIENDKGEYQVLCKGAESSVLKRCIAGPKDVTIEHVDYYASLGLRTLVIAYRNIDAQEWRRLTGLIEDAKQDLTNRDEALVRAFAEVEQGLTVIGATAVEDQLQDGVKETIEKLRVAGIKIWVLTGDKEETAVNISHSAGHIDSSMALLGFTTQTSEASAFTNLLNLKDSVGALELEGKKVALVVDGASLAMIVNRYADHFRDICLRCSTVLCCRMTPIQKSTVVRLVKESKTKPITAAIGDGANDVSMIQEAHVGIGIMGKEGRQASRSSDYAFGRFRFLQKAILVHGHYYYVRLAILVQYFFYKNVAFITANFWYIFFSAYSATSVYDTIFLTFYNVTFTSLPIYLYGLFEQHIPPDILLKNPSLYKNNSRDYLLRPQFFVRWNLIGLWYSAVTFFGVFLIYNSHEEFGIHGMQTDVAAFGTAIIFISSTAVNIQLMIITYYWTWTTVAGYAITFIGNGAMIAIYCSFTSAFVSTTSMQGVLGRLLSSGTFWLSAIVLILLSILPDLVLRAYNDMSNPIFTNIARSRLKMTPSTKHVLFISSDESISQAPGNDNGIAVISRRYIGEGLNSTHKTISGGGYTNPALITTE